MTEATMRMTMRKKSRDVMIIGANDGKKVKKGGRNNHTPLRVK
jgi:hypothetical protein